MLKFPKNKIPITVPITDLEVVYWRQWKHIVPLKTLSDAWFNKPQNRPMFSWELCEYFPFSGSHRQAGVVLFKRLGIETMCCWSGQSGLLQPQLELVRLCLPRCGDIGSLYISPLVRTWTQYMAVSSTPAESPLLHNNIWALGNSHT